MKSILCRVLLLGLTVALTGSLFPSAACGYSFTTLDFPGGIGTQAHGINDTGTVVGWVRTGMAGPRALGHGFIYDGNSFNRIDFPGADGWTTANDINSANLIVGSYVLPDGSLHGYLYDGSFFSTIDFPGAPITLVRGINEAGLIVGTAIGHGFVYDGSSFSSFDFPGASWTDAWDINSAGEIVGEYEDASGRHGFLYDGNSFTVIDFPGASWTQAMGINDGSQVLGYYIDSSGSGHGFLYDGVSFTTIDFPGSTTSLTRPSGINNAGVVVGEYRDGIGTGEHGFIATPVPEVPTLTVTYPNGGETLYKGDDYRIRWSWSNCSGNIRIHVYLDDEYFETIAANEPVENGTEGVVFNPPENWPTSDWYKIGISTLDDEAFDYSDDYFTITAPTAQPRLHGLFIGDKGVDDLNGSRVAEYLYDHFCNHLKGVELTNTRMITKNVTQGKIEAAIREMKIPMKAGDIFVIYIAGHGWRDYWPKEEEPDQRDEVIRLNAKSELRDKNQLTDDELKSFLVDMPDINKLVLLDACQAGGFWDDLEQLEKIAMIAAAPTGKDMLYLPDQDGDPLFGLAIRKAWGFTSEMYLYGDLDENHTLTVSELAEWIENYPNQTVCEAPYGTEFHYPDALDTSCTSFECDCNKAGKNCRSWCVIFCEDMWAPVTQTSPDFEGIFYPNK